MDFSSLFRVAPVQLPDPVSQAVKGMTLAQMVRQNRMGEEDDRLKQLERQADVLATQAYAKARQTGDSQAALMELSQQGEVGSLAIRKLTGAMDAADKSKAEIDYKRAQTGELTTKAKGEESRITLDGLKYAAQVGNGFASGQTPINDTTMANAFEVARKTLPESVYRTMPADPAKFKDWWGTIANPETITQIAQSQATTQKTKLETEQMPAELKVKQDNARANMVGANAQAQNAGTSAARLTFDKGEAGQGGGQGKAPAGYRWRADGSLEPIPGGPASLDKTDAKRTQQAQQALKVIDQADTIINQATGSYGGAALDQLGRVVGKSTDGALATAKLEALEGALMMAQPRMEGPQSDKDVALYKAMAGKIGDPTIPRDQKKVALAEIRKLHSKYVDGGSGPSTTASGRITQSEKLPDPVQLPDGAVVTDTQSGKKMVVRAGRYVPQ